MGVFLVNLNFALYDLLDNSLGSTQCSGFEFCLLSSFFFFLKKDYLKKSKASRESCCGHLSQCLLQKPLDRTELLHRETLSNWGYLHKIDPIKHPSTEGGGESWCSIPNSGTIGNWWLLRKGRSLFLVYSHR